MSSVELAAIVFAGCNSARVLAYIPQIVSIARDRNGARGLSCLTWAGFATSNLSTVAYALVALSDWNMAAVFGVNGVFCLAIVALAVWKRVRESSDPGASSPTGARPMRRATVATNNDRSGIHWS